MTGDCRTSRAWSPPRRWWRFTGFVRVAVAAGVIPAGLAAEPPKKTIPLPGGVEAHFVWIAPGSYRRGSPATEPDRDADEGPPHEVRLTRGFFLGREEVTQRQWLAVMGEHPSVFRQRVADEDPLERPVDSVSWEDARQFIERLNASGRGRFRLPTEGEWEFAARAGTTTPWPWDGDPHRHAWANSRSLARTHPVGRKPPNPWGLYDMHGNVWEWCSDWYGPYADAPAVDPTGPAEGTERVFRGGSWYDFPAALRSANRHRHPPDRRYTAIGLRLVLDQARDAERSATLPGGVEMRFARVRGGAFGMGSPAVEAGRQADEGPVHRVTLSRDYWLGVFEVTQRQWRAVMNAEPAMFQDRPPGDDCPVEMVSWDDAQVFLQRFNALGLGGTFRLPTEAEWEFAARAGTTTRFGCGDDPDIRLLSRHAWFYAHAEGRSRPVGQKQPNAWGLYDMHGNVWEWCSDWYGPYADAPAVDPTGPAAGDGRVIRGGSWFNEPEALRSANRLRHPADSRQTNLGLRVLWMPAAQEQ